MILRDKNKTPETKDKKTIDKNKESSDKGKGITYCIAKGCNNNLYGWTSSHDSRYCVDCR
jgi:hypothetical protein